MCMTLYVYDIVRMYVYVCVYVYSHASVCVYVRMYVYSHAFVDLRSIGVSGHIVLKTVPQSYLSIYVASVSGIRAEPRRAEPS